MDTLRVGFLGAGNMAGALIAGLVRGGAAAPQQLAAADPRSERLAELRDAHGIARFATNAELVRWANVVVLAVKPQSAGVALADCGSLIGKGHLLVSVAAGVPIATLEEKLAPGARVVRAMPNTPALSGAGATAIARGTAATDADMATARRLFDAVGRTVELDEPHLDAVTGLSGSGPAFALLFIEALADGGVKSGLPRDVAALLAAQTVYGAAKLLLDTGLHPAVLRDQVTSPGGTTIAGLTVLEARGVRGAVLDAVERAAQRATELGKKS